MRSSIIPGLALAASMTVGCRAWPRLGPLVEVEEEDGDLVLVWLE